MALRHLTLGHRPTFAGLATVLVAGACSLDKAEPQPEVDAPVLALVDSTLLRETDSAFVARPNAFAVTGTGHAYVADQAEGRIVHFDNTGRWVRQIGRRGRGPGEFTNPGWMAITGERLYVNDLGTRQVVIIDTKTDSVLLGIRAPGFVTSVYGIPSGLIMGMVAPGTKTTVATWTEATGQFLHMGPFPLLFDRVPQVAGAFGMVEVAAREGKIASAYEVSNHLYLTSLEGQVRDSVQVHVARRRGAQLGLFDRIVDPATATEAAYRSSFPFELEWLTSDLLAYVTLEQSLENSRIVGPLYLSVISLRRRAACADALLPVPVDPVPRIAFTGDTLWALYQSIRPDGSPSLWVKRLRVSVDKCQWR